MPDVVTRARQRGSNQNRISDRDHVEAREDEASVPQQDAAFLVEEDAQRARQSDLAFARYARVALLAQGEVGEERLVPPLGLDASVPHDLPVCLWKQCREG